MKAWILQLLVFMVFTLPDLLHFSLFLSICFFLFSALFLTLSFFGWWLDVKVRFLDSSTVSGKKKMFFMQFYWCWKHHILITSSYLFIYFFLFPFSCLERNGFVLIFLDFSFPGKKWGKVFFLFLILFRVLVSVFFFFFPFLLHDNNYRGKKGLAYFGNFMGFAWLLRLSFCSCRVFVEKFHLCTIDLLYVWIYGFQVKESIFDSGVLVFRPCDAQVSFQTWIFQLHVLILHLHH